jgi:hypothetical protein
MKTQAAEKAIIFDSSTMINFAMNGLLTEFRELKELFGGRFLITKEVAAEIIDKPMTIKRFELEALKIKELLIDKVLEMPSALGISDDKISKMTLEIVNIANNTFFGKENAIHIIDAGEASCLALSRMLDEKEIKNVVSVDERTIRLLVEKPENLLGIFQKKLHTDVKAKKENFKALGNFKFIRSAELIYIAYKKGIVKLKLKDPEVLDALLYALKFNGCSISDEEISEMEKIG